jgi:hypothetical protein
MNRRNLSDNCGLSYQVFFNPFYSQTDGLPLGGKQETDVAQEFHELYTARKHIHELHQLTRNAGKFRWGPSCIRWRDRTAIRLPLFTVFIMRLGPDWLNRTMQVSLRGEIGSQYGIEVSTNLVNRTLWTSQTN